MVAYGRTWGEQPRDVTAWARVAPASRRNGAAFVKKSLSKDFVYTQNSTSPKFTRIFAIHKTFLLLKVKCESEYKLKNSRLKNFKLY